MRRNVVVLYWWGGHCCPNALRPFMIYCAPPNLGITRTWICRLNFAQRPIFQAWGSLTSTKSQTRDPSLKSIPEDLCSGVLRPEKSIDLSRIWTREPWISRRARYPERPPRSTMHENSTTCNELIRVGWKVHLVYISTIPHIINLVLRTNKTMQVTAATVLLSANNPRVTVHYSEPPEYLNMSSSNLWAWFLFCPLSLPHKILRFPPLRDKICTYYCSVLSIPPKPTCPWRNPSFKMKHWAFKKV